MNIINPKKNRLHCQATKFIYTKNNEATKAIKLATKIAPSKPMPKNAIIKTTHTINIIASQKFPPVFVLGTASKSPGVVTFVQFTLMV